MLSPGVAKHQNNIYVGLCTVLDLPEGPILQHLERLNCELVQA